jgi:hypothetical protein
MIPILAVIVLIIIFTILTIALYYTTKHEEDNTNHEQ